jgi:hypothetical protein
MRVVYRRASVAVTFELNGPVAKPKAAARGVPLAARFNTRA